MYALAHSATGWRAARVDGLWGSLVAEIGCWVSSSWQATSSSLHRRASVADAFDADR